MKQLKCLSITEWMNKSYRTHRHTEYNGAMKINKIPPNSQRWMNLTNTMFSEWKKQDIKGHTLNNESERSQNSSYAGREGGIWPGKRHPRERASEAPVKLFLQ